MKRRTFILLVMVAVAVAVLITQRSKKRTAADFHTTASFDSNSTLGDTPTNVAVPEHGPVPVALPAEIGKRLAAQHEWIKKMNGAIEFYAKIIDQTGVPVEGAILTGNMSVYDEGLLVNDKDRVQDTPIQVRSDGAGRLEFKSPHGSTLRVDTLKKDGYLWNHPGFGSFSFGSLNRPKIPPDYTDPAKRLTFQMWKRGVSEPLVQQGIRVPLAADQEAYGVNLLNGKKVATNESPDLIIRIPLAGEVTGAGPEDRWFIFEIPNGGIIEISDVYPYAAPRTGYQPEWKWLHKIGEKSGKSWRRNFYVKARGGRVCAGVTITWGGLAGTAFNIEAIINPAGSPILEPDPAKQITDPEEIRRLDEATRVK